MKTHRFQRVKTWYCVLILLLIVPMTGQTSDTDETGDLIIEGSVGLSEVVQFAFANSPDLMISETRIRGAMGAISEARGVFDRQYFAGVNVAQTRFENLNSELDTNDTTTLSVGVSQLFRSGIELTPSVELTSERDRLGGFTLDNQQQNTSSVRLDASIPLLPLGAPRIVTADERAALLGLSANQLGLRRTRSEKAFEIVSAYWSYSAAHAFFEIAVQNEDRTRQMLAQVDDLVLADEVAAAQSDSVRAILQTRRLQRLLAAEEVLLARNQLATAIGLPPSEAMQLPRPEERFANVNQAHLLGLEQRQALTDYALRYRSDLLELRDRERAAEVLLEGAQLSRSAQLDMNVFVSVSGQRTGRGFNQGTLGSLNRLNQGPNIGLELNYSFAPNRQSRDGVLQQRAAERDEVAIVERELRRQIATNIDLSLSALRQATLRIQEAELAVELHQSAVERELDRHRLGQSPITEVLRANDDLANAEETLVSVRTAFSIALAQVLFELDDIVEKDFSSSSEYRLATAKVLGDQSFIKP